tara:strand:+ start:730 stop:1656 length:927 start_codon:yes stop_codon:yes gene_type:complete
MSKDLLKEAIADAKAVRSTAIANARLALEEAFTPKLQSMLSNKIAEEMDDELEEEDDLAATDTSMEDEEVAIADTTADAADTGSADDETEETGSDLPAEESYDEAEEIDEMADMDEDELELESIIKELEDEDAEVEETPVAEADEEMEIEESDDAETMDEEGEDEEMDLEEIISALREEDELEETEDEVEEESDLEEAYKVIRFLKSKINEVNLLNSKLLYSNKLFRGNSLSESQKMKVIETFDRANSVREVKLVYSTLAESITNYVPKKRVNESFASKTIGSTKPSKGVIVESNTFATRMQRLAGLK